MGIQVDCGRCGKQYSAPDAWAGRRARCPQCGAPLEIHAPIAEVKPVEPARPTTNLLDEEPAAAPAVSAPMADPFAAMSNVAAASPPEGVTLHRPSPPRRSSTSDGFAAWLLARKLALAVAAAGCLVFLIITLLGSVAAGAAFGGLGILIAATGLGSRPNKRTARSRAKPVDMKKVWGQMGLYIGLSIPGSLWLTRDFRRQELRIGFLIFCVFISVAVPLLGAFGRVLLNRFGGFRLAAWSYLGLFVLLVFGGLPGALEKLAGDRAATTAEAELDDEPDDEGLAAADLPSAGADWEPWPEGPDPEPKPLPLPSESAGAEQEPVASPTVPEPAPGPSSRPGFPEWMRGQEMRTPRRPFGVPDPAAPRSQPGPPVGRPPRPAIPSTPQQPGDTELVGGPGGGPFRSGNPNGMPVLGFRCTMGRWMSWTAPQSLEPLYDRAQPGGPGQTVLAREGYAVGAIQVDADQFVTAVRVVFMRLLPNGRLDKTDSYTSDWIGEPSEKPPRTLGGTGAPVLGVHGRRAAILDAVGLMLQED